MTFEEFQALCNQAVSTNQQVASPCPIVIGVETDPIQSQVGDTRAHSLIVFRMKPDTATLRAIYRSVGFSFDAPNNQTVIRPLTTGTGT
jgi:hypothetical protein